MPKALEPFLVPGAQDEIRIEVRCDWIDFASARAWQARSDDSEEKSGATHGASA